MDSLKDALLAASSCSGDSSDRDYLIIDSDFRTISVPRNKRVLGVYNDTSVNRVWFRAPRYYGDIDLSTYNFKINYINAQEDGDIYLVDDVTVDGNDIVFSWLVGYTAFLVEGNVIFNVCATLLNETGDEITNEFNTTVHTLPVLKGLEIDEEYIRTHYPSFIDQIEAFKNAAETAASSALESKNAAKASEIAAESSKNSAATSAEEALNSKTQAAQSAESALNSKTAAEESKTAAIDAKNSAESAAREALESKDAAKFSEEAAKRSEIASKESETNASNSAAAAALSEQNALAFKNAAAISETNAKTSETNALNSATSASRSATNAQESAEIASTAAFNAGLNAESARSNALAAQSSAEQANSSAISAGLNANRASRDAETASNKANEASSSATEAKSSENAAKASENAAKLSENNAKTSETNASRSETNSAENATRAEQAAENAEDFVENVVLVQPEQPTEENNRIWIKQGADHTIQVPTYEEHLNLKSAITQDQAMIATVEATATASKNYSVGDLLVYDGKLYKVTSAIATGATIIVGSNVTQTTVEDQLASAGSGNAKWTLIVDDTTTEDKSQIDYDISSEQWHKVLGIMATPANGQTGQKIIARAFSDVLPGGGGHICLYANGQNRSQYITYATFVIDCSTGRHFADYTAAQYALSNGMNNRAIRPDMMGTDTANYYTKIRYIGDFPSGTTVQLYGIK